MPTAGRGTIAKTTVTRKKPGAKTRHVTVSSFGVPLLFGVLCLFMLVVLLHVSVGAVDTSALSRNEAMKTMDKSPPACVRVGERLKWYVS